MDEFGDDVREAQQENAMEDEELLSSDEESESDEELDEEVDEESEERSDASYEDSDQESEESYKAKAVVLQELKRERSGDRLANALSLLTTLT